MEVYFKLFKRILLKKHTLFQSTYINYIVFLRKVCLFESFLTYC